MGRKDPDINHKLVFRAQRGDQQSMYRLYKLYVHAMYNTCIRMVGNQYDAEDIVQEVFISAFRKIDSYRGESSFGAWLKRIVVNQSLSFLRKKKDFLFVEEIPDESVNPEEDGFPVVEPGIIHEKIKSLPEKARVVLNLHVLEGYRHKEVAEMLEISESTSKSQYRRALSLLKEKIMEEMSHEI